jgi:hypothetical protein
MGPLARLPHNSVRRRPDRTTIDGSSTSTMTTAVLSDDARSTGRRRRRGDGRVVGRVAVVPDVVRSVGIGPCCFRDGGPLGLKRLPSITKKPGHRAVDRGRRAADGSYGRRVNNPHPSPHGQPVRTTRPDGDRPHDDRQVTAELADDADVPDGDANVGTVWAPPCTPARRSGRWRPPGIEGRQAKALQAATDGRWCVLLPTRRVCASMCTLWLCWPPGANA